MLLLILFLSPHLTHLYPSLTSSQFHFNSLSLSPPPMGNSPPHRLSSAAGGRVILSNGAVFTYDEPLTVAELMLEHPGEVVVEFQSAINGKKPAPLPADQKLEMRKVYLMLPIRKGKPAPLSSEEAHRLLTKTNSLMKTNALLSFTGVLPLLVRICPAFVARNDAVVKDDDRLCLAERKSAEEDGIRGDYFTDILEGRPEFLSRQISGKGWKPSLDPIREKAIKAKARHWMF